MDVIYLILFLHAGAIGVVENEMDGEAVGTLHIKRFVKFAILQKFLVTPQ